MCYTSVQIWHPQKSENNYKVLNHTSKALCQTDVTLFLLFHSELHQLNSNLLV